MYSMDKKRAVVTGAASGLGKAISLALARNGWKVLIADINDQESENVLKLAEEAGGSGSTFHCDVTKADDIEAMADFCFKEWGGVDLLVNNAGVAVGGIMGDLPLEDWRWVLDINLWGVVCGCHVFIPRMKTQGGGYIVNVASNAGIASLPEMGPYNITKAGAISLSETLKSELAPHNIGVTVVCPTFFKTNLTETFRYTDDFQSEFFHAAFDNAKITSEEIADMIVKAIRKKKFYVLPQGSAKLIWYIKRISPSFYHGMLAWLMKRGLGRKLLLGLARRGLT